MMPVKIKYQGLALVQVLLLVAMLSILLLLMMANTQQQQKQVIALQNQLDQHFRLYSQSNEIVFNLLTNRWDDSLDQSSADSPSLSLDNDAWHKNWNFYAYPFSSGNYTARITNLNSLVSMQGTGNNMVLLLQYLGYAKSQAERLANELRVPADLQNISSEAKLPSQQSQRENIVPIQHVYELSQLPGWDKELMQRVAPYVTTFNSRLLNEAYMPDSLLEMVVTKAQADIIRNMRSEGTFNRLAFQTVTELVEDELRSFFVGPDFRIEIWHNDSPDFVRVIEVRLLPYQSKAVQFRYRGWGY